LWLLLLLLLLLLVVVLFVAVVVGLLSAHHNKKRMTNRRRENKRKGERKTRLPFVNFKCCKTGKLLAICELLLQLFAIVAVQGLTGVCACVCGCVSVSEGYEYVCATKKDI